MVGPRPVAIRKFQRELLVWFDSHARDLPWRRTADLYRIWVSEIMLQQTRVTAVIDYYSRFLTLFPTLPALALADRRALADRTLAAGGLAAAALTARAFDAATLTAAAPGRALLRALAPFRRLRAPRAHLTFAASVLSATSSPWFESMP